ncbi:MAG: HD domain-containing protein [Candidatus Lernaella stagnicola]|nr:HD domain-containing protein [Candidatus Lernaella stagnicola]
MAGNAKILMFEPEPLVREAMTDILGSAGYTILEASTSTEARRWLHDEEIDLIICDVGQNGSTGMDVVNYILKGRFGIDVIVMTSYTDIENVRRIVDTGVYDIIPKPVHVYNLLLSVQRALETRRLSHRNRELQSSMEKKIKEKMLSMRIHSQEKQQLLISIIRSLVSALEAKDKYTEGHSRRVADNAVQMAETIGFSTGEAEEIHLAGLFHDIGKIGISEVVLNKKGRLTDEEYDEIKRHPQISQKIVEQVPQFKRIARIVRAHHEFYDGQGYPDGARRDEIPVGARIMAICDAHDAMTSTRPYREALPNDRALSIIRRNAGTQFDPELVHVFLKMKNYVN